MNITIAIEILKKEMKAHEQLEIAVKNAAYLRNKFECYGIKSPVRKQIELVISNWRNSDNIWLNRTCLIFQLKYKNEVDFELLKSLIVQYQPNKEFFIQKAIGWSLRQYSKFNPEAISTFINDIQLEGLAKREASKYLA